MCILIRGWGRPSPRRRGQANKSPVTVTIGILAQLHLTSAVLPGTPSTFKQDGR